LRRFEARRAHKTLALDRSRPAPSCVEGRDGSASMQRALEPFPAVDGQRLSDDVPRLFADEEDHGLGDVLNVGDAARRDAGAPVGIDLAALMAEHKAAALALA
jgi:hypothetical protein